MTDDAQRIALAEFCGWVYLPHVPGWCWPHNEVQPQHRSQPPRYLEDLNAVLEAKRRLTLPQRVRFLNSLRDIVSEHCEKNNAGVALVSDFDLVNSDAREQSRAVLQAIGQWVD